MLLGSTTRTCAVCLVTLDCQLCVGLSAELKHVSQFSHCKYVNASVAWESSRKIREQARGVYHMLQDTGKYALKFNFESKRFCMLAS